MCVELSGLFLLLLAMLITVVLGGQRHTAGAGGTGKDHAVAGVSRY